ncbi:zeta toxin family protein [Terrabacter sp. Ter38]|uniref:zeta toxin family protein n=1 Tax=Terrabacter sp. Ter38 TaxID=2926030 RepID=UPI0021180946|nr:zeta toxin family protein [Terrabacter sp. Ter38]
MSDRPLHTAVDIPQVIVVTGVMAAGKSTVSQLLAERFTRAVHLRGDEFRRVVVRGRVDMSPHGDPEAERQLALRHAIAATPPTSTPRPASPSSSRTSSSARPCSPSSTG